VNTMSAETEALLERSDVRTAIRQLIEGAESVTLADGLTLTWVPTDTPPS